jgi:hypothetical protein
MRRTPLGQLKDAMIDAGIKVTDWEKIQTSEPVNQQAAAGISRSEEVNIDTGNRMLDGLMAERDELLVKKTAVQNQIADCRAKIGMAKQNLATNRQYSDPVWYRETEARIRELGQEDQSIQRRLARLRLAIVEQRKRVNASTDAAEPVRLLLSAISLIERAINMMRIA